MQKAIWKTNRQSIKFFENLYNKVYKILQVIKVNMKLYVIFLVKMLLKQKMKFL